MDKKHTINKAIRRNLNPQETNNKGEQEAKQIPILSEKTQVKSKNC